MYCAASDVGLLLQLTFSVTSEPTQAAVEYVIAKTAARIDLALRGAGFTLPVTDSKQLAALESINALGSAGYIGMSFWRNVDNVNTSQAEYYWRQFLKELDGLKSNFTGVAVQSGVVSSVAGGSRPWETQVDW